MTTEQRINEIFGTKGKLIEFQNDWNKLLESDSEDEECDPDYDVTSGLADDLSSTLRCSEDDFEADVSDIGLLDSDSDLIQSSSQDVTLKPDLTLLNGAADETVHNNTVIVPDGLLQIHADEEEDFDSGLEFYSSSSSSRPYVIEENNPVSSTNPFRQPQPSPKSRFSTTPKRNQHKHSVHRNRNNADNGKRTYDDLQNRRTFYNSNHQRQSQMAAAMVDVFKHPNRPNSRSSSVSAIEPPLKHARYYSSSIEFESDQSVIDRRTKQIDYGKNTIGYQNYTKAIPKNKRKRENPITPDKYVKYSRRSWDQQVKIWRRKIHEYDPEDASNNGKQCLKNLDFDQLSQNDSQPESNNDNDDNSKENQQNATNIKTDSNAAAELDIDISDIVDFDL